MERVSIGCVMETSSASVVLEIPKHKGDSKCEISAG